MIFSLQMGFDLRINTKTNVIIPPYFTFFLLTPFQAVPYFFCLNQFANFAYVQKQLIYLFELDLLLQHYLFRNCTNSKWNWRKKIPATSLSQLVKEKKNKSEPKIFGLTVHCSRSLINTSTESRGKKTSSFLREIIDVSSRIHLVDTNDPYSTRICGVSRIDSPPL